MSQQRRDVDYFVVRFSHSLVQSIRKLWHKVSTGHCLPAPTGITTHLNGFSSENWIELTQLTWSKPGVNNPFLSMMIRPWVIPSVDHESGFAVVR